MEDRSPPPQQPPRPPDEQRLRLVDARIAETIALLRLAPPGHPAVGTLRARVDQLLDRRNQLTRKAADDGTVDPR